MAKILFEQGKTYAGYHDETPARDVNFKVVAYGRKEEPTLFVQAYEYDEPLGNIHEVRIENYLREEYFTLSGWTVKAAKEVA